MALARCGRTDSHGAHTIRGPIVPPSAPYRWCAGNVDVITEQASPVITFRPDSVETIAERIAAVMASGIPTRNGPAVGADGKPFIGPIAVEALIDGQWVVIR